MALKPSFAEIEVNLAGDELFFYTNIAVGEHDCTVMLHPRGVLEDNDGEHFCLFFYLRNRSLRDIDAIFEAFVVVAGDAAGERPSPQAYRSEMIRGLRHTRHSVWRRFARRSDLEPLCAASGGVVTVVCGVTAMCGGGGGDMGSLLGRADSSDVSVSVGGEAFPAHRRILAARSPVLKEALVATGGAAAPPCITLQDIEPETFKLLLRFIYTDGLAVPDDADDADQEPTLTAELLQDLLAAAERFRVDKLKLVSAYVLGRNLTVDNVAETLACAELHGCPELKSRCLDFFMEEENFREAALTEGYFRLRQRFPSVIEEMRMRSRVKTSVCSL